ncbi:MAG TPA: hypothetical protein VF996_03345 [Candidatus Saccharimonadales bacterium]|jgi:hypothetical protein
MSSPKPFMFKFNSGFHGLWSGEYPAHEKAEANGSRLITVEFLEECRLSTSALASEITQISTKDIKSAMLVPSCSRLVLELYPESDATPSKVLRDFTKALAGHLNDLPTDRHNALTRVEWLNVAGHQESYTSEKRIANAMAAPSLTGWNDRDH